MKESSYFLPYQLDWLADKSRRKIWEKSRRIGATYVQSYEDVRDCVKTPGLPVWFSSADESAAKEYILYCEQWAKIFKAAGKILSIEEVILDEKKGVKALVIQMANGSRIHGLSSNPTAFRSKGGKTNLDEFDWHTDQPRMYAAAKPCVTWGYDLRILSTYQSDNHLYAQFVKDAKKAVSEGKKPTFSLHTVTIFDAVEQGLLDKIMRRPTTTEEREAWLAEERDACGDENIWLQEYCCIPVDENDAFLTWDLIRPCEDAGAGKPELASGGAFYIGNDIGRRHDLAVFWVIEKVGDIFWTREVVKLKGASFAAQDDELDRLVDTYNPLRICMDQTGMGEKPVEDAKSRHGNYRVEGLLFTGPVKQELAFGLRRRFEDRQVRIPVDQDIRRAHHAVKKTVTVAGNIRFDAARTEKGHCYDDQTDVLTRSGWKSFKNISLLDKIAALETGRLVYQKPIEIQRLNYKGEVVRILNKQIDLLVTPNHKLFVRDKKEWKFIPASQTIGQPSARIEFKKDAKWEGKNESTIFIGDKAIPIDTWLEFMGYFISQGFTSTQNRIGIYGKNIELSPIRNCIEQLPFSFWLEKSQTSEVGSYRTKNKDLYEHLKIQGRSWERFIPRSLLELTTEKLKILLDALIYGNGQRKTSWSYTTTSSKLASDFQELLLKVGHCGSISIRSVSLKGKNKRTLYGVNINRTRLTPQINKRKKSCSIEKYSGEIFCCTVSAGIIYVRRNGKCCWCGNSDEFWAHALALHGASEQSGPMEYKSIAKRRFKKRGAY